MFAVCLKMDSAGFPGLADHFTTKVSDLQKMIDIKNTLRDDSEFLEHVQVSILCHHGT